MRRSRVISQDELRELLQSSIDAGIPICAPTVEELATVMAPESLVALIWRRNYGVRLSPDRESLDYDDDIPVWLFFALAENEKEIVALMRDGFLATWVDDGDGRLRGEWASLVPARYHRGQC